MVRRREYYSVKEVSERTGINTGDLIHWGETGQLQLYVNPAGKQAERLEWDTGGEEPFLQEEVGEESNRDIISTSCKLYPITKEQVLIAKQHNEVYELIDRVDIDAEIEIILHFREPLKITPEQLVITSEDFDNIILKDVQQSPSQPHNQNTNLILIGILLQLQGFNGPSYQKGNSPNYKQIAEGLAKRMSTVGIEIPRGLGIENLRRYIIPKAFQALQDSQPQKTE